MKLYLSIKADENDGDYLTERSEISEADLERFMPLIEAIKKNRSNNWVTSEYGHDSAPEEMYKEFGELANEFGDYVPHGEHGVHTIESISLLKVLEEVDLL